MKSLIGERRRLLLIPLAALVAVLPLIHHGPSCGHDFDFHLLSWMEAARQFALGNFHPHWAYTPAFNAGEPRFVFYPPLSWTLGALIGLLLTHLPGLTPEVAWSATPVLYTWIALTLAGLALYRLAREFANSNAALIAATLYLANPYMLFTAYERTAYAELLAAAWIPLLLYAILRERVTISGVALPVALLWLTNAPAAVMGSYALAFLALFRVLSTYRTEPKACRSLAVKTLAGTALGLALTGFYLIPAAYERRFVQIAMATIAGMRIDANFLFEHTGNTPDQLLHDAVLHTASLIAVGLLLTTAAALLAAYLLHSKPVGASGNPERSASHRSAFPALLLALLTVGIAFLLTSFSLPLWQHAPEAAFLQFPWRLLAILAPVCALSLAHVLSLAAETPTGGFRWRWSRGTSYAATAVVALVLTAALTHAASRHFRQSCDPEDSAPARLALFHSDTGTDPTDEYTPTTADNDALNPEGATRAPSPAYWLAKNPEAPAPATDEAAPDSVATSQTESPSNLAPMHLKLNLPRGRFLILNLRDFPGWRVTRNGVPIPHTEKREDGLITIPLPVGPSSVDINYIRSLDQTLGDGVTGLALVLFAFTLRRRPAL